MDPPRSFLPAISHHWFKHRNHSGLLQCRLNNFTLSAKQKTWDCLLHLHNSSFLKVSWYLQSQDIPMPTVLPNKLIAPGSPPSQYIGNHEPALGRTGAPLSSSYAFAPASYGQMGINLSSATPSQALPQVPQVQAPKVHSPQVHGPQVHVLQMQAPEVHAPCFPAGVRPRLLSESQSKSSVLPVQETGGQPSVTRVTVRAASIQDNPPVKAPSDWVEHTFAGRRTSEEESFHKEIFGEYTRQLKQQVKEEQKQKEEMEKGEREKRKAKQKREKASEKRLDEKSKRSDKDKKQRKRHQSAVDDPSWDRKGKHKSKNSSKSSSDFKRSRQMEEM